MSTVFETLQLPTGAPATGTVIFYLVGDQGPITSAIDTAGATVVRQIEVPLDATGSYSVSLTSNDNILPANTVWARSYNGGRIIDTLDVGTAGPYDATDIRADPPGSLTPTELAVHAADTTLHGGGRTLASALLTQEVSESAGTAVNITEGAITFVAPTRNFVVEFIARLLVGNSGAIGNVQLHASIGLGAYTNQGSDGIYANVANTIGIVRYGLYVPGPVVDSPNSPQWHRPVAGDTVNYKLMLQRAGGTGTVTMTPDNALLGKSLGYLRAYQV